MMSIGALKMPEMAETVPDSRRSRAICGRKRLKYSIIAIPPLRNDRVVRLGDGLARSANWLATRGSQTFRGSRSGPRSTGRTRRPA